ncbi:MAG TPA: 2-succinyl-5-enolpyruvyl-6-hydroxy-3-cyclohexene-1-carboxylic-acid synthase [Kofleriaceae bacterium]|nr:2-succinyl-5-enolpyruvyl-6-hydroxy-3-cyclohexene-1-carboxylic-acid synthase [Kofleriaceae bacterium]
MTAAIQTLWVELVAATLADAGVATCVISPGSRSAPLVAALARDGRLALPTIIDERAAAFFALGIARATGRPAAIACTSGSAAAHYLPALVEASAAGVPLIAITADRPPELQRCGATQTIDQIGMYGGFVRGAFDLGPPCGEPHALRAVRRAIAQAVTLACGPHPGPVHVELPLRKPLEPAAPASEAEHAAARAVAELRRAPIAIAAPRLAPDPAALDRLAAAIAAEPRGLVIAGAMPLGFAAAQRDAFALCARAGYPLCAEAGSQLRFAARPPELVAVDGFDVADGPPPRLIVQLGAEPVAASWPALQAKGAERWVLADHAWHDPDGSAREVIVGDVAAALGELRARVAPRRERGFAEAWRDAAARAQAALDRAIAAHAGCEPAALRAAIAAAPPEAIVQIGNSLPIRVIDHACPGGAPRAAITQRGAAGIDGLVASAAGATRAGVPVLLVLGDVSFAHDLGGVLATREAAAPLAIVVVDNAGGQIFAGLPIARAGLGAAFERHFTTAPALDPVALAAALGVRAVRAAAPAALAAAVAGALAAPGATIIHAPVTASGAHDVRRTALELVAAPPRAALGGQHG